MINRGGGAFGRGGGRGGRSTLPAAENSTPSVSQAENSSAAAYDESDWVSCLTTSYIFYYTYARGETRLSQSDIQFLRLIFFCRFLSGATQLV